MRSTFQVGRIPWCALAFAAAPAVASAQGGTSTAPVRLDPIYNLASAAFTHDGTRDTALASTTILVARRAVLSITGPFTASVAPGQRRVFAHLLSNSGTNDDVVRFTATIDRPWPLAIYGDVDGNGRLTGADTPLGSSIDIATGSTHRFLVVIDVPDSATIGATSAVRLSAASGNDAAAVVATTDALTVVPRPAADVAVAKTVDQAAATAGDTLRYAITLANVGDGDALALTLTDTLPRGLQAIAGSVRVDGGARTDAADADSATVTTLADGRSMVQLSLGTLLAGSSRSLTLAAAVTREAVTGTIANVALAEFGDSTRTVTTSDPAGARTAITVATLTLTERLVGTPIVIVGAQVQLRLTYANTSTITARGVVLVDTLPRQLVFESATGATVTPATATTGQVVAWALGDLPAGTTGSRDLYLRVGARTGDGDIGDQAHIRADNALTRFAGVTANIALFTAGDLTLTKTAGVLEAAVGDAVPYTIGLRNTGLATLRGVVIRDRLPEGMRFAPRSLTGADSADVDGQDLAIFLAPMAPSGSVTVRYAAVVATPAAGATLVNRAMAEAEGRLVRSDTASAAVSQRGVLAMRERTMIGKVWLDRNDDGFQQAGEEGVAGVQVWDVNGDFSVTDKEGRFSFRAVTTGAHVLRLDPAGIPRNFVLPTRADELVTVQADGWSLPSTSFRLVPRAGVAASAPCECDIAAARKAAAATLASVTAVAGGEPAPATAAAVTVAPLLGAAARAAEARQELIVGPGVRVVAPMDGAVLPTHRFFAGVRGVPGAVVGLYDGARLLRTATLRGDGSQDFVNVELEAGPHRLRIATLDSAATIRGDSVAVHVSGPPSRFVLPAELPALRRDAAVPVMARVRVLDRWNVPVTNRPMITVLATGATIATPDEDASSLGLQVRADAAGWVMVPVRAGFQVGAGDLRLSAAEAKAQLPVRVFASVRPLSVTGVGQLGVGGAPESFGAVTMQGAITENTSVAVSVDSRRGADDNGFFQRGFDPRGDEQYPTVGDNSTSSGIAPTTRSVSARLEHGMDWLAAGDVQTLGFGRDGELGAYRRSVTGVSGRVGTGALTWHGFGSMTQQAVERTQRRADGSTGPYLMGSGVRPGTEVVAVEVRARDNAARLVTRQQLARVVDYQIDYATGAVLLRMPVPSTDPYGNPVFVVATVERLSGGASRFVGGLRLDADAARFLRIGSGVLDSLTVGLSGIRDETMMSSLAPTGTLDPRHILNADLRLRRGALALGASILRSQTTDSTGTATSATASWALPGERLALDGRWMSVGEGIGGADPRLASPLTEAAIGLTSKLTATSSLRLHRAESRFTQLGVTRGTTGLTAEQVVRGFRTRQELALVSESGGGRAETSALTARVTTALSSRLDSWVDGTRSLTAPAGAGGARPDQIGTGFTLRLPADLKLEGSHRVMHTPGDSVSYRVTSAQLRAEGILGGQVWTGFEQSTSGLRDEVRAGHSALLGWNQQLHIGAGWQVTSLYERRIGLRRASLAEPERAMPFAQVERDRWSAAAGLGWMPAGDRARVTVNAEMQDGEGIRSSRLQLAGDAALNAGLAIITLNDWSARSDATQGIASESRQDRSLLGVAMRPVTTNRVNALTKLEWRRTVSPVADALRASVGRDLRMIASSDVVWMPVRGTELSTRYALRMTTNDVAGDSAQRMRVADHFGGARLDQRLAGPVRLRADGRLLMETESRTALWNVAPSVVYDLQGRLLLEAGYRFGALRDPDFAAVGGSGAFATIGFRFTEGTLATPAAFWRDRIANDR
jgi:uncharacterized repeat protein (TIGR01451 family)